MLALNDGRSELWQWDTGRKLTVDADCSQVHFSNKVFGRSIDVDVVDGIAIVPDILLQTDKELTAWAFVGTPENGYTKISKVFKVNRRNKPADYVFTPPEQTTLAEIMERLDDLEAIQDPDAIKNAVEDYLEKNPFEAPVQSVNEKTGKVNLTAKDVGAISQNDLQEATNKALAQAKESGEFDGKPGYTPQKGVDYFDGDDYVLTPADKREIAEQAAELVEVPESGGSAETSLNPKQINALDALFRAASYTEDVSSAYAAFCDAFGLVNPDDVILAIKQGTVSFETGKMVMSGTADTRATLVPLGQYLEKGKTYRFGIGNIADKYYYGVQIMVAESANMVFPYVADVVTNYDGITERLVDTGWIAADFTYTPDIDNCILAVNFKGNPAVVLNDSNYAEILENFVFEETAPIAETTEPAYFIHRVIGQLNDTSMSLSQTENTKRIAVYSATMNDKCIAWHNGTSWGNSEYSPLKIPVGAVAINVDTPSTMRYGAFIAKPHDTNVRAIQVVVDSGWITDGSAFDVSGYNDGTHYLAANVAYISNDDIQADFDTSVLDVYFVDANGNRMS